MMPPMMATSTGTEPAPPAAAIAVAAGIKALRAAFSDAGFTRTLSSTPRGLCISKNLSSLFPLFRQL
jgi:hypothetical protein